MKEKHKFDFTNAKSDRELLLNLDFNWSIPKEQKQKQLYAHEIGHMIGLILNDRICKPFGIPTRISFANSDSIFEYNWTDEVFKVLREEVPTDFYGIKGYEIAHHRTDCGNTQNYINKSYDTDRFPPFITYLILGGIFHLHWDSIIKGYTIEAKHYHEIFSDSSDANVTTIIGAAGSDWTKVRMYCGEYKIPYEALHKYPQKLYKICLENGLFNYFASKIDEIYNLEKTEYTERDLNLLNEEINSILEDALTNNAFLESLKDLQIELTKFLLD